MSTTDGDRRAPLPLEVAVVWTLYLLDATAMLVTYTRVAPAHLYHVSGSGLHGGLSRVLVFSNFSAALVAIATLLILLDRLGSTALRLAAITGIVLCTPVFWPGVVDEADLDARPVNAIAALGVVVTLALTLAIARNGRSWSNHVAGDRARAVAGAVAALLALPWIAAELGLFLDGIPLLGRVFQTGSASAHDLVAVHHGHHHGLDGLLLLLSALLLSRAVPAIRGRGLRALTAAYLALMTAYAIGNIANDFWTEQVWKRGWTSWQLPNVLEPKLSVAWGVILLGAVAIYLAAKAAAPVRDP